MSDVFLAFSYRDFEFANQLKELLKTAGHVVISPEDSESSKSIDNQFAGVNDGVDVFVPILSKNSINSPSVWREIGVALGLNTRQNKPLIVPIAIDDVVIPGGLSEFMSITMERGEVSTRGAQVLALIERSIVNDRLVAANRRIELLAETASRALARAVVDSTSRLVGPHLFVADFFSRRRREQRETVEQQLAARFEELGQAGIDPELFDSLLSNEIDRQLKKSFGITFIVLAVLFAIVSYVTVLLDAIFDLGISTIAITAIVIEIPIQFFGLLYIIAKNLFPNDSN